MDDGHLTRDHQSGDDQSSQRGLSIRKRYTFFTSPVIMALKSYLTSQIVDQILAIPQTKTVFGQPFFP